ncbi:hypothetical protein BAU07_26385 (plasmid) [Bordetella flabilis]|uniref:Uncharacterized protein n=1 Tax=Bordetella flabilis TaxID=463014 RepID=A0A193GMM1_9BORD|nr:hypothetical protein BAU07_26385 [Bordetella flabilis]
MVHVINAARGIAVFHAFRTIVKASMILPAITPHVLPDIRVCGVGRWIVFRLATPIAGILLPGFDHGLPAGSQYRVVFIDAVGDGHVSVAFMELMATIRYVIANLAFDSSDANTQIVVCAPQ